MSRRRLVVLALLVAAAAVPVALRRAPEAVAVRDGAVTVRMDDFRFHPQRLRARRGRLTITVRNGGRLPHAFRLERGGREIARVLTRKPGEQDVFTRQLRRGRYSFYCPIANHTALGMHGTLTVP